MLEKNPKTLKVLYKSFPLKSHKLARPAVEGALAAGKQGRFWEFHDKVFEFLNTRKLNEQSLAQLPIDMGLDMSRYLKDMKSPVVKRVIERDMREGRESGVRGTPSLFINGIRVQDRSPAGLQKMIDSELKRAKKKK